MTVDVTVSKEVHSVVMQQISYYMATGAICQILAQ